VPILVAGLLFRRWASLPKGLHPLPAGNPWLLVALIGGLLLLLLPVRLVEEATPEWRPLQWVLAVEVLGITLYAVYLAGGKHWLRQAAFPILFFLVAVPWPSPIEQPVIQGLSRLNAQLVVEVLTIGSVPAIQHGNLIEVSTGTVGINDACSGIRSLQSSLMIALFLGEFYRFGWLRRLALLPIGFLLAMVLNLCRASILAWIAAKDGLQAIAKYHDQAGLTILLICTACLFGMGWLMNRKKISAPATPAPPVVGGAVPGGFDLRRLNRFAVILLVWVVLVEAGVAMWYHLREARLKPGLTWTVDLPTNNPTFQAIQPTEEEHILLRFDEAHQGRWMETDGTSCQAFYFGWKPGRVAGYLAKRHTPDICLTATGLRMIAGPTLKVMKVRGVDLPMRHYTFEGPAGLFQVFQCHWEAGVDNAQATAAASSRFNLIRGIWAGRGNQGQKVLQVVVSGVQSPAESEKILGQLLDQIIKVEAKP
jgi:exosortase